MFNLDFEFADALLYAIPLFTALIFFETSILYKKNAFKDFWFYAEETVASLSSGNSYIIKTIIGLEIILVTYPVLLDKISIHRIVDVSWWHIIGLVLIIDLLGYFKHLLEHKVNIFWNFHRVHHTGEIFNLPTALRQSISEIISYGFIFSIPIALLGFPISTYLLVSVIHFFAQFWYHTEIIGRLGFLEKILVTPTNHKIHHAMNAEYMDKNFAQIFIFWDFLFGTYQDTIKGVEPVVGDSRPSRSHNFLVLNFHHFYRLLLDAFRTNNFWDKFKIWFMPTGWRPKDVVEKYPILAVKNPELYYNKFIYQPVNSNDFRKWIFLRFIILQVLIYLFFFFVREVDALKPIFINVSNVVIIGTFLFINFTALTILMDRNKWSWFLDFLLLVVGIFMVIQLYSNEISLTEVFKIASMLTLIYLLISFGVSTYFSFIFSKEKNKDEFYLNKEVAYRV